MIEDYTLNHEANKNRGYEYEIEDISTKPRVCFGMDTDTTTHDTIDSLPMYVLKMSDLAWYEIDEDSDLEFAEKNIQL